MIIDNKYYQVKKLNISFLDTEYKKKWNDTNFRKNVLIFWILQQVKPSSAQNPVIAEYSWKVFNSPVRWGVKTGGVVL